VKLGPGSDIVMIRERNKRRQFELSLNLLLFEAVSLARRQRRSPKRVAKAEVFPVEAVIFHFLTANGST
jgi:hypothetical protein